MSVGFHEKSLTLPAAAATAMYLRCHNNSSGQWAISGATDKHSGISVTQAFAIGDQLTVEGNNANMVRTMTAAGAFSAGALLYGAAGGKVDDDSNSNANVLVGRALEAATNDGDLVKVVSLDSGFLT